MMHKIGAAVPIGGERRALAPAAAAPSRCCCALPAAAPAAPRFPATTARVNAASSSSSTSSSSSASSPSPSSRPPLAPSPPISNLSTIASTLRSSISAVLLSWTLLAAPMVSAPQATAITAPPEAEVQAVEEYAELEAAGKMRSTKALDDFRNRYRMRRTVDGRLQVKSSKGEWWAVRLDMEVPGALLLRDPAGNVYAVQTETLQQIDLSDDYVCLLMFADGAWEEQMAPVDFTDEKGATQQLKLQEKEFREVVGILKEAAEEVGGEDEGR